MRKFPTGTITLLFTDIEKSTRLLQQLKEQYAQVLSECRRLLRNAFQQWNGFEVDAQGDAFFIVFEQAKDALMAAVAVQQALYNAQWPEDVAVRVRIGMHTGEPQAVEEGYVGLDVHRAARIMSAAHGGQVLLSRTTRDLVTAKLPEDIHLHDLGEYRLKDIVGQSQLFQLDIQNLPSTFPPLSTTGSFRTFRNISFPSSTFVGREQEMTELSQVLQLPHVRLLTLIGTAGVGKTRLALQLAAALHEQLPISICFVALEHIRDKNEVISAIAQALGVQEEKKALLSARVKAILNEQPALLVLDNFEQVFSAGPVIADLLANCPDLKVLVTSRVMLHLRDEHLFEVLPLPLPSVEQRTTMDTLLHIDSIALFIQRAQALQPGFQLTNANAADIVEICTYLDGIPLAIELAAAHIRHFSPSHLLARLRQGTIFLQGKARDVPERQQTLRNAIEWSYNLLTPDEQAVFRRMAAYSGDITLDAAQKVCNAASPTTGDIAQIVADLVDQSMVQRQENEDGETRFGLLQALREYGLERLAEAGELDSTQAALSEYLLLWAERGVPLLVGSDQIFWLNQFDREHDNMRIALVWMIEKGKWIEQALRLCVALATFWENRCYFEEGLTFLEQALADGQEVSSAVKAQALYYAGFLALIVNETARAEAFLRESQLLFRESGDNSAMAGILRLQGNLALVKNNYKIARRLLEEARNIDLNNGNMNRAISTRFSLSQVALGLGNYQQALQLLEGNLEFYKTLDQHSNIAYALYLIALTYFSSQQEQGRVRQLIQESLALFKLIGDRLFEANVLDLQGQVLSIEGDEEGATAALEESKKKFQVLGNRFGTAKVLISQARVEGHRGEWERACALYRESWKIVQTMEAQGLFATCIEGYGEVLVKQNAVVRAVQLWGLAATIRAAIAAPMPPVYRSRHVKVVASARKSLSEEDFLTAWREGGKISLRQLEL